MHQPDHGSSSGTCQSKFQQLLNRQKMVRSVHKKLKSWRLLLLLQMQIWAGSVLYHASGENAFGQEGPTLRLPRNRILKLDCHRNELDAMEFVKSRTNIPIPRILKVYEFGDRNHLVMEMASSGPWDIEIDYRQMSPRSNQKLQSRAWWLSLATKEPQASNGWCHRIGISW